MNELLISGVLQPINGSMRCATHDCKIQALDIKIEEARESVHRSTTMYEILSSNFVLAYLLRDRRFLLRPVRLQNNPHANEGNVDE
jgi:hypothetical protein